MMKADKMTVATLMTKTKLAPMLRLGKRKLVTMGANKTWVPESLTEIDLQDLLESTVFEIPYNNDCVIFQLQGVMELKVPPWIRKLHF